jgi:hypothetical protein
VPSGREECDQSGKDALRAGSKKNKLETPAAIVSIIRKAPTGMTSFSEKVIPDKDAETIARYILQTFQ